MGKLKTAKGVKDRFTVTGTGKVRVHKSGRRHLLAGKRAKLKRRLRRAMILPEREARKIRALLPYA